MQNYYRFSNQNKVFNPSRFRNFGETATPAPHDTNLNKKNILKSPQYRSYLEIRQKYSQYFLLGLIGTFILFAITCTYFLYQNYEFFAKIGIQVLPQMVEQLDREFYWLVGFLGFSLVAAVACSFSIYKTVIDKFLSSFIEVEALIRDLNEGKFSQTGGFKNHDLIRIRKSYTELKQGLFMNTLSELRDLKKLQAVVSDEKSKEILYNLINSKSLQLGLEPIETSADTVSSAEVRHVS